MTVPPFRPLTGKTVLLGIGASIAAYRACDVIRGLRSLGAKVVPAPTQNATAFVSALTFEALSGRPCLGNALEMGRGSGRIAHVEEAYETDLALIAPATADLMAKMACGLADEGVLATLLSYRGPLLIAPAMESLMWTHPATERNVTTLKARGALFVGPDSGSLASGREGVGRLAPVETVLEAAAAALSPKDLQGKRVLITAGPTAEDVDPVRFLTNRSTGKMGVALARAAIWRGAQVALIHGPLSTTLPQLEGLEAISVRSANEMHAAVEKRFDVADAAIFSAAVADFRPEKVFENKRKKRDGLEELALERTTDILATMGKRRGATGPRRPVLIGFAAETQQVVEEARRKLSSKGCDLICANDVSSSESGFASPNNQVTLVSKSGEEALPAQTKDALAHQILDRVIVLLKNGGSES